MTKHGQKINLWIIAQVYQYDFNGEVAQWWRLRSEKFRVRVLSWSRTGFVTPTQSDDG